MTLMIIRSSSATKSLVLSVASLTVAAVSVLLGQQLNYLNHLPLFNQGYFILKTRLSVSKPNWQ